MCCGAVQPAAAADSAARLQRRTWSLAPRVEWGESFMMLRLGRVCEVVQYPVKSMAGIETESAFLGWHGLDGDRRFAFRRLGDGGDFPWLSASRLPELLRYHPFGLEGSTGEPLSIRVLTPAGANVELCSAGLQSEVAERLGSGVELMKLKHGIFDEFPVSVISLATIAS